MDSKKNWRLIIGAAVAFTIASLPPAAGSPSAIPEHIWAINLETVPSYGELILHGKETAGAASVVFVDANTLAVTYRVVTGSSLPEAMDTVTFFDADSGSVRDSLQWPSNSQFEADRNFIRVLPTRNGEFLVVAGRYIRRFSSAHKELNARALGSDGSNSGEWVVRVSPDGKTAHLKRFGPGANDDHWVATETLEDQTVAAAPFYEYGYQVGNGFVAYRSEPLTPIRIHTRTGEDRALCPECRGDHIAIVGDRLFFAGIPSGVGVVTKTDGTVLLRKKFASAHQRIGQVSVARDSSDVAFYISYLQAGLSGLRSISTIVVLDTATLRELQRFDFQESGQNGEGDSQEFLWPMMALSPDGTKLALLGRADLADKHDRLQVFPITRN